MSGNMLENKMLLETAAEPKEQDPDEAYDQQRADNDHANLRDELISIAQIQAQTARIESLTKELQDSLLSGKQGE